jgi:site-specific DNA-methyltransferase (adenine-specific)
MLLLNGDCIEQMQKLIDDGVQVDSIVTDPPYHLTSIVKRFGKEGSAPAQEGTDGAFARASKGFMGKEWDGGDIAFRPETWKLALKLLKPGGYILAFSASRNYHRMAVAIEDAGFEIRDQMMWLYGSGFPKSLNLGNGWGTALKPAHEPIVMARKSLEGTNKQNMEKYGVGGINIDGCRIEGEVKHPPNNPDFRDAAKQAMAKGGVDKLSFGQDRDAPIKRKTTNRKSRSKDGVWTDGNSGMKAEGSQFADADPKGRFPANVMHDGSDVVKDIFPTTSKSAGGGGTKTVSKNKTVFTGGWGNKEYDETIGYGDEGSAARYFYCPKVSKAERNQGLEDFPVKKSKGGGGTSNDTWYEDDVNSASGKFGSEKAPSKNTHPTVKPQELMKYLCRMVTPKGGTVLDIFMGSGSTGMAAKDEGFDFIGIEKDKEYFEIAEKRIKITAPLSEFME